MGKRKTRGPEVCFQRRFDSLFENAADCDAANKLRKDLALTVEKQCRIIKLIRNKIPDAKNADARNVIHHILEHLLHRVEKNEELTGVIWDHGLQLYKITRQDKQSKRKKLKVTTQETQEQ
ncbi:uncharacterized protein PHALS_03222 [Plasmopara halstedii]|uniref:Uncharacterized protein n=1 Tax=Plasmopara halstedii TaxID=4781 RepID=A0A0P1AZ23_PLAHL|nr:uncharacterized protein PHALS_03222 [Plasmopara halstedii]CEG46624.1 hypothetical protein PHALS_03222 [Plasmopara halstedii]|eukprot:XP_024582993.1 hypothetical protein PHALS_03222 [Plasmopara halstedii]